MVETVDMSAGHMTQGTGLIDTINMMRQDLDDPSEFVIDGLAFGVELLGFISSPLSTLLSYGIGWLIEHVAFLEEPLNKLAGNPEQVRHIAAVWGKQVKSEIADVAADYKHALNTEIPSWEGVAASAYHGLGGFMVDVINALESAAAGVSGAIRGSAVLVATTRGIIRDLIASVVSEIIIAFGAALASSWFTFGGSLAAFTSWSVARAASTASTIAEKIATLLNKLSDVLSKFSRLGRAADELSKVASKGAGKVDDFANWSQGAARRWDTKAEDALPDGSTIDDYNSDILRRANMYDDYFTDKMGRYGEKLDNFDEFTSIRNGPSDKAENLIDKSFNPAGLGYTGMHETVKGLTDGEEKYQEAVDDLEQKDDGKPGDGPAGR